MTDLKAKIKALPTKFVMSPHANGQYIDRKEVLTLITTYAADLAPVAVEGSPSDRIGSWLSAALDDPKVCAEMKADINAWFAAGMPRADLAPTGNTALVEAALTDHQKWERSENLKAAAELDRLHKQVCFENGDHHLEVDSIFSRGSDAIRAALSQPAAPQPTPEVEALLKEADEWTPADSESLDIVARLASSLRAALARGSVAEKGERT